MTTPFLHPEHHPTKLLIAHLLSPEMVGQVVILTIDTLQVAAGKKDGSRTSLPDKRRFLTKMRPHTGHHRPVSGSANSYGRPFGGLGVFR